jgi:oleate hydratase
MVQDTGSDMSNSAQPANRHRAKAFLVGGGIAALASAAFLLRDGGFAGQNIQIFEGTPLLGGSLDGAGSPSAGYTLRGGRMVTYEVYTCMFDLLSFIPSLTDATQSVKDEIYDFNERFVSNSHARLIAHGQKLDASDLGLSNADRLDLIKIMSVSEGSLGASRIVEQFQPPFFKTNFWYMWCTTFAFQPWHSAVELKRYLHRFIQELPRIHTLGGVRRTPYNQYDSIVRPLVRWLTECGVRFTAETQVTDLLFRHGPDGKRVEMIEFLKDGATGTLQVGPEDLVFVTNGSMTAASSLGSMTAPARPMTEKGGAWDLWKTLSAKYTDFGRPSTFDDHVDESRWLSFTITLKDPLFFNLMEAFTGNAAGTGGLVTFTDSSWLMSLVLPYQPHFIDQPTDVQVCWGYGLFVDQEGDFVKKKMVDCTGEDLLVELLGHLQFAEYKERILASAICIPCMMPLITSQFMPRITGDRPQVRPIGTANFAFIGQYCEIPDDVVFTVEYSVRTAQTAVYSVLGLYKHISPIFKGQQNPAVLFGAAKAFVK